MSTPEFISISGRNCGETRAGRWATHALPDTPVVLYTYTAEDSAPEHVFGPFPNLAHALERTLRFDEEQLWDIELLRSPPSTCVPRFLRPT